MTGIQNDNHYGDEDQNLIMRLIEDYDDDVGDENEISMLIDEVEKYKEELVRLHNQIDEIKGLLARAEDELDDALDRYDRKNRKQKPE